MADEQGGQQHPVMGQADNHYHGDEVSLRELYLILRAGLPLIVGFALLSGVIAFAVMSLRPESYEATA
ncbi:MAG TPA: hypothetical protein VFD39_13255, partial [Trueperaceae bacterium]|nr:hypothetical protein [Trueperaceae bacterium]